MASSSSSTFSSAAAHSTNKPHQVFINHCEVDVKSTFARFLYLRLREKGLTAFLNNKKMEEGYEISSQLENAIRNARVHVAIFSPRYAESQLCLNELRLMLKSGAPIIPIFYDVTPGTVRWGLGSYDVALGTHEKGVQNPNIIKEWRTALNQVANNSGFELKKDNGQGLVIELLDKVVESLLKMVPKKEYPTALDHKLKDFEDTVLLTQQQRGKPQIFGIVGLGGVGKTTLAKEFFNKKKSEYDKCCFLSDVKYHATNSNLNVLQSQLLNSLIGFNKQIDSVDAGKALLTEALRNCKAQALIILDDVDHVNQVKAFLPQSDVLNSGTLFLITSRDKNVFRSSKVENSSIYSLSGLDKEHSLELFCFHAFSQPFPLPEFTSLVDEFVDYCNGLPLALKVFGALLYGKEISEWKDEWESLRQIVTRDIHETFKISYNSLNQEEKDMFLDIACFLAYLDRDTVIGIWNESGWRGNRGFLNLQNKCLVELDAQNRIHMHDLLIDMGREVAASSLPRRLCGTKDVFDSLSHHSSEIRGIQAFGGQRIRRGRYRDGDFDSDSDDDEEEDDEDERSFRRLQILQMRGSLVEPIFTKVKPPDLLLLKWIGCPHPFLPSWVSVKNLRVLQLFDCELNTLWHWKSESQAPPVSLEELEVMHCQKLKTIRGWGQARKLKVLVVSGCSELEELPSMETLASLEVLQAQGCKKLKGIRWSTQATKLKILHVLGCSELEELPRMETLASLEELCAEGCKKLKCIRGSAQATKLKSLHVSNCSELEELPSIETLASLEDLQAKGCTKLKAIRGSAQATKLKVLNVSDCSELEELPSMETLASLEDLRAKRCTKLKCIRGSALATKLEVLDVSGCSELEELPSMETLASLKFLVVDRCPKLKLKGIRGSATWRRQARNFRQMKI